MNYRTGSNINEAPAGGKEIKMNSNKTRAAVINNGILIGFTRTALKNGEHCCYGYDLTDDGCMIQSGTGKISRAKNWMSQDIAIAPELYVNNGAGGAQ